jgi:hypothetical protein
MGPMNDDDEDNDQIVTWPAEATPVKSDPPKTPATAGEGSGNNQGVEEGPGMPGIPGMEEAGYGYGV